MEPEPSYKKTMMSCKIYFQKCSCSPTLQYHYLVQFLNDSFELLISQGGEQFTCAEWENEKLQVRNVCRTNKAPQGLGCDEALALLVVDPEGVLQLLLHRLHVRVLDQEGGAQLAELTWSMGMIFSIGCHNMNLTKEIQN